MKILYTAMSVGALVVTGVAPMATHAAATACTQQKIASKKDNKNMSTTQPKAASNLHRSRCMIELILKDIDATYDAVSGGGISSIKAASSTSYVVSLPQEERVDLLTYDFTVKADGSVSVKSKVASTQSVGPNAAGGEPAKK
jgi:hypothetical protein